MISAQKVADEIVKNVQYVCNSCKKVTVYAEKRTKENGLVK